MSVYANLLKKSLNEVFKLKNDPFKMQAEKLSMYKCKQALNKSIIKNRPQKFSR